MASPAVGSWLAYSIRNKFPTEWALSQNSQLLVIPRMTVPLLPLSVYLAVLFTVRLVGITAR